ncbi:MAG: HlyD family efflux transporter periplasmic adaptor subunit [Bacteroidota bacterium]
MRYSIFFLCLFGLACQQEEARSDAFGNFEAKELLVSAENTGKLMTFQVEEGQWLEANQVVGYIDTTQLDLKRQQLRATIAAVLGKLQGVEAQNRVYEEQKKNLDREIQRLEKLLADGAATPKQLDDLTGQYDVIERQRLAHISSLQTANRGISSEVAPLRAQIAQIDDQIQRSVIRNPQAGQVLTTFAEPMEVTMMGRPLYKLADTRHLILRVYASAQTLEGVSPGQEVEVLIDAGAEGFQEKSGTVSWVSQAAEFTPKIIQTKEERVNLVYAVKIRVPNAGDLRIGMPGEVNFSGKGLAQTDPEPNEAGL